MRTSGKLILLGACLTAAGLMVFLVRDGEPRYQSRPLSYWVMMFDGNHQQAQIEQAEAALNHTGTNALPWLLTWLRFESSAHPVRMKLGAALDRWTSSYYFYRLVRGRRECLSRSVTEAFQILGARATPAIPELTRLLNDPSAPETAARATLALAYTGTNSLPALLAVVDRPGHACRYFAVWVMPILQDASPEPLAEAVVPHLIGCLSDQTDPKVAPGAVAALRSFKSARLVVPALTTCLGGTNAVMRRSAARALEEIGARAAPALPALTNALQDPDPAIGRAAKDAILAITGALRD